MAKLSMPINTQNDPEVDVIAEDIASALAQLSWLFEGRIDYDNVVKIVDGFEERALQIPASKVQDIPLISNEINCNKFFRDEAGTYGDTGVSNSFIDLVWEPLKNAVINNPILTLVQGTEAVAITKDTLIFQRQSFGNNSDNFIKNKDYIIEIEIPKNYTPITYRKLFSVLGIDHSFFDDVSDIQYNLDDFVVEYEYYVDTSDGSTIFEYFNYSKINIPSYSPTTNKMKLDITVNIGVGENLKMEDGDFVNVNLTMSVLCEERI